MRLGSPRPLERVSGKVRDSFEYLEYVCFRPLTSIFSLVQGKAKNRCGCLARRRFFKVPVMGLIAFLLQRLFYTSVW